jgi:hypothetical protein
MAHDVHITISFEVIDERRLVELAGEALTAMPVADDNVPCEAHHFLSAVYGGRAIDTGRKGSVCAWGYIGNYSDSDEIATALLPFFSAAYSVHAISEHSRIAIFSEDEQSERAYALVIECNTHGAHVSAPKMLLPFSWGTL